MNTQTTLTTSEVAYAVTKKAFAYSSMSFYTIQCVIEKAIDHANYTFATILKYAQEDSWVQELVLEIETQALYCGSLYSFLSHEQGVDVENAEEYGLSSDLNHIFDFLNEWEDEETGEECINWYRFDEDGDADDTYIYLYGYDFVNNLIDRAIENVGKPCYNEF